MVAIVTGASSGLGLSIAQRLREQGTSVIGVARRSTADVSGDAAKRETALRAIEAAAARTTARMDARVREALSVPEARHAP